MKFLRDTDQGIFSYAVKAAFVSFSSAALIALLVLSFYELETPEDLGGTSFMDAFGYIVFAPIFETLLMIPIFKLIGCLTKRMDLTVILSALIWAGLHSLAWLPWGIFAFSAFCVFSYSFLIWREVSLKKAIVTVTLIHGLRNTGAFLLGLVGEVA
ncbi:hypothetical protein MLD52_21885 [Puniceicoccaceae bacterium K14]|nr:hypothetical protein [Puniceicoccaceae bacterium K14]